MVYGRTKDAAVRQAVFNGARSARLKLIFLNFKAVCWGRIQALKRLIQKKS